ncbi:aryl hydrocarbon receptor protein 1-like isoform X2 [Macrosteles quadrilineatus]|uniref:aryl hydrocarbon receptor protein 1-like isoform X2 n=1 Tax=Macrosteles quadrilineatus TaxID=74068 RepID=UPI0023E30ED4|nr:aryl hydrocarbon receptor protein 1-like isoform X2 [Macrosteles quadrilineatus]
MNQLGTVYATKRRRRNGKSLKPPPKDGVTKSNPSKRHRERLNAELDTLANLLPFEQNILSKLDRLSILRLSVSYLRTKSYFQVTMHKDKEDGQYRGRGDLSVYDHSLLDGDMFLQALNGFLLMLTCEGEVFFATHNIENYLGFHQSDIVHQSVYELVHSEDREELQRQLMWNSYLPAESAGLTLQEALQPDRLHLLERSFTVRFRCLLDNTSGFLRLDIRGRIKILHGQNRKTEEPPLALFAICTPFGPPSLLEIPHKEVMFKSKHKLDLALVSMDQRGKMLLGYTDGELANMGGYDLVHFDDLAYVASAHQELLKTGASGMIAYRFQTKDGQWQWLQTSSRLVYKNSKPDFVISTHRPLMEEEGRDLLGKRTMDFKVSYLDAGLTNSYFSDSDQLLSTSTNHSSPSNSSVLGGSTCSTPQRLNRRYKTQLRDFLSTCRTKRKLASHHTSPVAVPNTPVGGVGVGVSVGVDYIADTSAAAAVAAAYNMYSTPYPATPATDNVYMGHSGNFHQGLYDNRFLTTTENLFHQYRPLGTYYTEYHHPTTPYVSNGFLDISPRSSLPTYETSPVHQLAKSSDCDKLYGCHQSVEQKYSPVMDTRGYVTGKCSDYMTPVVTVPLCDLQGKKGGKSVDNISPVVSSPSVGNGLVTPKLEDIKSDVNMLHYTPTSEAPRQTVLMWGSGGNSTLNHTPTSSTGSCRSPSGDPGTPLMPNGVSSPYLQDKKYVPGNHDPLKSLAEMNSMNESKWKPDTPPSPKYYQQHYSESGSELNGRRPPDKQDGSPLLSISEVTKTLLNQ